MTCQARSTYSKNQILKLPQKNKSYFTFDQSAKSIVINSNSYSINKINTNKKINNNAFLYYFKILIQVFIVLKHGIIYVFLIHSGSVKKILTALS